LGCRSLAVARNEDHPVGAQQSAEGARLGCRRSLTRPGANCCASLRTATALTSAVDGAQFCGDGRSALACGVAAKGCNRTLKPRDLSATHRYAPLTRHPQSCLRPLKLERSVHAVLALLAKSSRPLSHSAAAARLPHRSRALLRHTQSRCGTVTLKLSLTDGALEIPLCGLNRGVKRRTVTA
jgi:hypothetical protein